MQLFLALPANMCSIFEEEVEDDQSDQSKELDPMHIFNMQYKHSSSEDSKTLNDGETLNTESFNEEQTELSSETEIDEEIEEEKKTALSTFIVFSYSDNADKDYNNIINKYILDINNYSISFNQQYQSTYQEDIPLVSLLDVSSISPMNIAFLSERSEITTIQASLEVN